MDAESANIDGWPWDLKHLLILVSIILEPISHWYQGMTIVLPAYIKKKQDLKQSILSCEGIE